MRTRAEVSTSFDTLTYNGQTATFSVVAITVLLRAIQLVLEVALDCRDLLLEQKAERKI